LDADAGSFAVLQCNEQDVEKVRKTKEKENSLFEKKYHAWWMLKGI
jgi:hypothetical protein